MEIALSREKLGDDMPPVLSALDGDVSFQRGPC